MNAPHKSATVSLLLTFFLACGGAGKPKPGDGGDFSSLPTEPTDNELWSSIGAASPFTAFELFGGEAESQQNCEGGGTATLKQHLVLTSPTSGSITISITYDDCHAEITLGRIPNSEVVNGKVTTRAEGDMNEVNGTSDARLSFSGDIGYAADCSLRSIGNTLGEDGSSGTCTFYDNAGEEIIVDAEDAGLSINL